MKTAELTGALLDYWVAKSLGGQMVVNHSGFKGWAVETYSDQLVTSATDGWRGAVLTRTPEYSTDWAQGGPIIERECIGFFGGDNSWTAGIDLFANLEWGDPVIRGEHLHYGSTPLEAAMRTYVASKFGDEVPATQEIRNES